MLTRAVKLRNKDRIEGIKHEEGVLSIADGLLGDICGTV